MNEEELDKYMKITETEVIFDKTFYETIVVPSMNNTSSVMMEFKQSQKENQQLKSQLQNISDEFLKYDWENSNPSQLKNQIVSLYQSIFGKRGGTDE